MGFYGFDGNRHSLGNFGIGKPFLPRKLKNFQCFGRERPVNFVDLLGQFPFVFKVDLHVFSRNIFFRILGTHSVLSMKINDFILEDDKQVRLNGRLLLHIFQFFPELYKGFLNQFFRDLPIFYNLKGIAQKQFVVLIEYFRKFILFDKKLVTD